MCDGKGQGSVRALWCALSKPQLGLGISCSCSCSRDDCVQKPHRIPDPKELLVEPAEVADVVAFLCTPESRAIRGQTIVVDKGMSNRLYRVQ